MARNKAGKNLNNARMPIKPLLTIQWDGTSKTRAKFNTRFEPEATNLAETCDAYRKWFGE